MTHKYRRNGRVLVVLSAARAPPPAKHNRSLHPNIIYDGHSRWRYVTAIRRDTVRITSYAHTYYTACVYRYV